MEETKEVKVIKEESKINEKEIKNNNEMQEQEKVQVMSNSNEKLEDRIKVLETTLQNEIDDHRLLDDPDTKEFYLKLREEVKKYSEENNVSYMNAYKEVLPFEINSIVKEIKEKVKEETKKQMIESAKHSPGPLSGPSSKGIDFANASSEELEKFIAMAKRGSLRFYA